MGNAAQDRGLHGEPGRRLSTPHLLAALVASLLVAASLSAGAVYAQAQAQRAVHRFASANLVEKRLGGALQQAAFRQPDLLPIYGSSELINLHDPYHGSWLFQHRPTGFTLSVSAEAGVNLLNIQQQLAAVGPAARGRKVVISIAPGNLFCCESEFARQAYAGNYSRLQANALAFSTDLSGAVKQAAARRMLEYPRTLDGDPLLRFALERLVDGSPTSQALYALALPLGKLHILVLRLQDYWELLELLRTQPEAEAARRPAPVLDWPALAASAEQEYRQRTTTNPFGFDDWRWERFRAEAARQEGAITDQAFIANLSSTAWDDLDGLLATLAELGAEPLVLSAPLNAPYLDYAGVSAAARRVYYERLRQMAARHGAAVRDFADHEGDRFFAEDQWGHISSKGWVHYAQVLDAFFHGALD
jgi:D-alanine transfer protein